MTNRLLAYIGLALLSGSAVAQQYNVVELPYSASGEAITASGMNGLGAVTGQGLFPNSQPGYENFDAFAYQAGSLRDLGGFHDPANPSAPATLSYGNAINSCGLVVGSSAYDTHTLAALFAHGGLRALGTLGGPNSIAYGINAKGHVTGYADLHGKNSSGQYYVHAFLYSAQGGMQDIGTLGGVNSIGYAINASDQMTGGSLLSGTLSTGHAFIYSNGSMQDLGTLNGGSSIGISINADGHVAGVSDIVLPDGTTTRHAFLYSNGVMQDITPNTSAASGGTYAYAINDYDEIVGSEVDSNGGSRAFIYANGTMTDLNTLIGSASSQYGLEKAVAINDRGQIAVDGGDSSHQAVFLLTPVKSVSRALRDVSANCQ